MLNDWREYITLIPMQFTFDPVTFEEDWKLVPAAVSLCSERIDTSIFYDDQISKSIEFNPSLTCIDGSFFDFKGNYGSALSSGYQTMMIAATYCDQEVMGDELVCKSYEEIDAYLDLH